MKVELKQQYSRILEKKQLNLFVDDLFVRTFPNTEEGLKEATDLMENYRLLLDLLEDRTIATKIYT